MSWAMAAIWCVCRRRLERGIDRPQTAPDGLDCSAPCPAVEGQARGSTSAAGPEAGCARRQDGAVWRQGAVSPGSRRTIDTLHSMRLAYLIGGNASARSAVSSPCRPPMRASAKPVRDKPRDVLAPPDPHRVAPERILRLAVGETTPVAAATWVSAGSSEAGSRRGRADRGPPGSGKRWQAGPLPPPIR